MRDNSYKEKIQSIIIESIRFFFCRGSKVDSYLGGILFESNTPRWVVVALDLPQ